MPLPDRQQRLGALRDIIADIERKPALLETRKRMAANGDGFPMLGAGALQEIFTDEKRHAGAMLGFALAQSKAMLTGQRHAIIYLQLADESQKLGLPYGPGLLSFGLDPAQLVLVRPADMVEMLWAIEEAIACRAVAAIVADIGSHSKLLDFTASRRLSLRSTASGGAIMLLRYGKSREASAAHLRWRLTPTRSARHRYDPEAPGPARWRAELEKGVAPENQTHFLLEWTKNGFSTQPYRPDGGERNGAGTALPRALPAPLANRLSQTA